MINEEDIVFNDAEGTDKEMNAYEHMAFRDYGANINWDDPMFFTSSNDWCNSITYDCIKENIRYTVIINYEMAHPSKHITILSSIADGGENTDRNVKKITMIGDQYNMGYFLDYIDNEVHPSSSVKFTNIVRKFTTLKAFL
jgi:hypothetical protein